MSGVRAAAEQLVEEGGRQAPAGSLRPPLNIGAHWVTFSAEQLAEYPPEKEFSLSGRSSWRGRRASGR